MKDVPRVVASVDLTVAAATQKDALRQLLSNGVPRSHPGGDHEVLGQWVQVVKVERLWDLVVAADVALPSEVSDGPFSEETATFG